MSVAELPLRERRGKGTVPQKGDLRRMPLLELKSAGSQADLDWAVQAKTQQC